MGQVRLEDENKLLILKELSSTESAGLLKDLSVRNTGDSVEFNFKRMSDGAGLTLRTNLIDSYSLAMDGMLIDFTDYVTSENDFKSHIKWFMAIIYVLLKGDYKERRLVDVKSGQTVFREVAFNTAITGKRSVSTGLKIVYSLGRLTGKYKEVRGPSFDTRLS